MLRLCRAVGRSENPGVPLLFGGHNLPSLVDIGLTDLPKSEGAMAPPANMYLNNYILKACLTPDLNFLYLCNCMFARSFLSQHDT